MRLEVDAVDERQIDAAFSKAAKVLRPMVKTAYLVIVGVATVRAAIERGAKGLDR